ncbi:MAG: DUF5916 domain-containing protein [Steroidobacteraceae bacterium]|nr:hypothetical protein [Nevskiaceae bacterium]MCP5466610.1 hypothetical protein [Nevskiaceae bacterium]
MMLATVATAATAALPESASVDADADEALHRSGIDQGPGFDLRPSLALTQREGLLIGDSSLRVTPSLDLSYRAGPSLRAALTVNADFSTTEVDERQVNLTRFPLYYPEKRAFFLEDAALFEFGGLAQNGRPFFSRAIGLSATGQPVDLEVGGRFGGSMGRYTLGALAIRQEATPGLAARDLFVARGSADLDGQSTLGGIFTWGDPASEQQSYLGGVDLVVRNQTLVPERLFEARGWVQRSRTEGTAGREGAWGLSLAYPNDTIEALFSYSNIGERFRPALGFVDRSGIQEFVGRGRYRYLFDNHRLLRSWQGGGEWQEVGDQDERLESRALTLTPVMLETRFGDTLAFDLLRLTEVLRRPFPLPHGLVVRPGQYQFDRLRLHGRSAELRDLVLTWDFEHGDFFDGKRRDTRLGFAWQANAQLHFGAQWQTNALRMVGQEFTAKVYALTANVAFAADWTWLNIAQYDNVSGRLGLNSRLRWLPRSGQSVHLVVNYDWREDAFGDLRPYVAETTLKFGYSLDF